MPYNPPVRNEAFVMRITLEDAANPGEFKNNPTIASGDFKVDVDGLRGNILSLPTATGDLVYVELDPAEMDGDVITITAVDQTSPKEWLDFSVCILTTSS